MARRCRCTHVVEAPRDLVGEAPHARRHAAGDGLADDEQVGFEAVRARVAAGTRGDRVRLVDQQQGAGVAREAPQLGVEPGLGEHHAGIGHHGLGDHAGHVAVRERGFELGQVVELDDARELSEVGGLAQQARTVHGAPAHEPHEGLVHRAVVAAVEHQDLRPTGDGACHAQREAVRIGGRRGDLPLRQAEALGEQPPDCDRVLGGQHAGEAAPRLPGDGLRHGRRRVAEHRARVAETEVRVVVAVHVVQHRAARGLDHERVGHGPVAHPVHGHALVEAGDAVAGELHRPRVQRGVAQALRLEDLADALQGKAADDVRVHERALQGRG